MPILGASIVSRWFKGKELGLALGIYNISMPLGTLVCLNTYGIIGLALGWRVPIIITTVFAALVLFLFFVAYRPAPIPPATLRINRSSLSHILIAVFPPAAAWLFFQATSGSFNTFAILFFRSVGYSIQLAPILASAWMLGSLILSPVVGGIIDRFQNIRVIIIFGSSLVLIALALLPHFSMYAPILMVVLAIGAALVPTAVLTATPQQLEGEEINIGFSLVRTFASLGFGFGPLATGILRDLSGDYTLSFTLMAVFMIMVIISIIPLRKRQRITIDHEGI